MVLRNGEASGCMQAGHGAAATTPLAIAMPIAMSVFTTNATLAAVAFVSAAAGRRRSHCRCGASVDPPHFVRDVAFYSAALLLTALVLSYGKVSTVATAGSAPARPWRVVPRCGINIAHQHEKGSEHARFAVAIHSVNSICTEDPATSRRD